MELKFPFFHPPKSGKAFLVLDIGTEVVKTLIFKKREEKIVILGAASQYFDQFGVFDSRDFEKDVLRKAIFKSLQNFDLQNLGGQAILGLPADIFKARVIFRSANRQKPKEIINNKEEKGIYQTILKEAQKEISRIYAQKSGILPEDVQFIDSKILEIKIDGYEVPGLRGYNGKKLEFRIFYSFLPKYYLQNFEKITKELDLGVLKITHPVQNLIKALGLARPFGAANAIFLDVGGEITQVFFVKEGKIEGIHEFEVGGRAFSQALSQALGLNEERARDLKERYSGGLLGEESRARISEIFSDVLQEWLRNLRSKLRNSKSLLPSTIFLFGGGCQLPEIQGILDEGDWEVKFIYPKDLKSIIDTTHTLNNPKDINLLLLCYAR